MKKIISLLLATILLFSMAACSSKKAFEISKQSFEDIHSAYQKIETMSADVYEAWRIGVRYGSNVDKEHDDLSFLTESLSLSDDDIYRGLANIKFLYAEFESYVEEHSYLDVNDTEDYISFFKKSDQYDFYDSDYDEYDPDPIRDFILMFDDTFSGYVYLVVNAYEAKGTTEEISTLLNSAKEQMKTMSDKYSDYEHYPNLKDYYTTTQAFFDYCQKPTGTFEQAVTTIEDYKNTARDRYYDLEFIFVN